MGGRVGTHSSCLGLYKKQTRTFGQDRADACTSAVNIQLTDLAMECQPRPKGQRGCKTCSLADN